jgi:hypothetical protein
MAKDWAFEPGHRTLSSAGASHKGSFAQRAGTVTRPVLLCGCLHRLSRVETPALPRLPRCRYTEAVMGLLSAGVALQEAL